MTTIAAEPTATDAVSAISHRIQCEPAYVVRGNAGERFYAAKWRFPPHRISATCTLDHVLCCLVDGGRLLGKTAGGKILRKHANPGAVAMIPSGEAAQYSMGEAITALELYFSPALFDRFSQEYSKSGRVASMQPFFVVEDPWLKAYFDMLKSEVEMYGEHSYKLDTLLLNQSQQLLFGHLLRRYCDLSHHDLVALDRPSPHRPLRPHLLKRVTDFVQTNLAADIHLADLAQLVHMSERHFIRAFRATAGSTPYQYVIEKRLQACAERLRSDNSLTVAQVAVSLRFNNPSHFTAAFRAHYGITPRRYRLAASR